MSNAKNPYLAANFEVAALAAEDERASFITKTYLHLVGAIGAFILIEAILLNSPLAPKMMEMLGGSRYSWLMVMGAFMFVSYIANSWALSSVSLGKQYMGLSLYVVAQAIITLPLLYIAQLSRPDAIPAAAITTLGLFGILTLAVFITRKDFSFLRSILFFGGFAAFGLIGCAIIFNFALGPIFIYAMIALACGYILYDTSNVLHHYRTTQYVAASLALFASVALLFWYILQLFMSRD
jgi:FtsH-binding integral membrane protein